MLNVLCKMKLSAVEHYCKTQLIGSTVHDQFQSVIDGLRRLGFSPVFSKVCGSSSTTPVNDLPKVIDGDDGYQTQAHGRLQNFHGTTLKVGELLPEGKYVLIYLDKYCGSAMTPAHQWAIAVEADKIDVFR
jgi:hypothetical protein